ncbi:MULTISPECIES: hypothetical protein [unclassified Cupriavidus]|uniref:hypothetical protein n=1 Tax=unclassified Cupriavidus TaxID=2640874 RepID=UPI00313D0061
MKPRVPTLIAGSLIAVTLLFAPLAASTALAASDNQRAATPDSTGPGISQGSGGAGAHPIDSNHPGTNAGATSGATPKHGRTKQGGSKSKQSQSGSGASAPAARP